MPPNPWDREALRALRVAIYHRDEDAVDALCARHGRDAVLQLAGAALTPAGALAIEFAEALRRRGFDGDDELADALEGRSELRPLAIDLDELSSIVDGDPVYGGGRVDLATGEVWHSSPYDVDGEEDDDEDSDRWVWVAASSRGGWSDMADFIVTVADDRLADRLERAIHRKGAFRSFRDEISEHPDEHTRFQQFSDERALGRARRWLAEHGLRPS